MSRTTALRTAALAACASLVLAGCSSDDGAGDGAATSAAAAVTSSEPVSPSAEESFDITLVPATTDPEPVAESESAATTTIAEPAESPTPSATRSSAAPSAATSAPPVGAAEKPGRWFAFIKSVDTATRSVTFDEAQFLGGDAAREAMIEDKKEPDAEFYLRNVNKRLRTAPLTEDAQLRGSVAMTQQVDLSPITLDALAEFAATDTAAQVGFWVTVDSKLRITAIEEQYIP